MALREERDPKRSSFWPPVLAATMVGSMGLAIGLLLSRLRVVEERSTAGKRSAEAASETLRLRNSQLTALYNVFSEITETLTLRYVVDTTLRETLRIMTAEMVVLRKLEGDQLVVIGALADGGVEIKGLDAVSIEGQGPTSRAARKGRSIRIDTDGELTMGGRSNTTAPGSPSSQTGRAALESGVITPLIVGARVVGTMSCWSRQQFHFNVEDERLLEMMASSVATAIVASETVETTSRHAYIDPLTDLPNRRQLNEDLHGLLANLGEKSTKAVVAMADIDHFKRFNDDYGHKMGDITLQTVAGVLVKEKRESDHIYRYGGEEFVIIFLDADGEEAETLAERLRAAVEGTVLDLSGKSQAGAVTISIGLACMPLHGDRAADLIELADIAMYQSKTAGRNQVTVWHAHIDEEQAA